MMKNLKAGDGPASCANAARFSGSFQFFYCLVIVFRCQHAGGSFSKVVMHSQAGCYFSQIVMHFA